MESWKQSGLVALVAVAAMAFGGLLQAWIVEHGSTPYRQEVSGMVAAFSGTTAVLTDGRTFEVSGDTRFRVAAGVMALADLRPGDEVGVLARPLPGEPLRASLISVFDPAVGIGLETGHHYLANHSMITVGYIEKLTSESCLVAFREGSDWFLFGPNTSAIRESDPPTLGPGVQVSALLSDGVAVWLQTGQSLR